jgi:hypothetical protein
LAGVRGPGRLPAEETAVIDQLFLRHPRAVGESYLAHAATAGRVGFTMIGGGLACLVHAAVPALFTTTGSGTIRRLHAGLSPRRDRVIEATSDLTYDI